MLSRASRERLEGWVSDFCASDGLAAYPSDTRAHADELLLAWLVAACERGGAEPEDLDLADLRGALLETVAPLDLPASVHARVPDLCRDLLAELEASGRLADGRALGLALAAARPAYDRAVAGEVEPLERPGPKIGRNDPCPCGSGKKFKRCCMRA